MQWGIRIPFFYGPNLGNKKFVLFTELFGNHTIFWLYFINVLLLLSMKQINKKNIGIKEIK